MLVGTPYKRWFERITEYGFAENVDFTVIAKNVHDETAFGGVRTVTDHAMTLDMAKEISMIQRTDKGKQARQYFIQLEKLGIILRWSCNAPYKFKQKVEALQLENEQLRPKALFADAVSVSHTSILIGELAKLIKQNGVDVGAKRLFSWLREKGYLIKRKGTDWNMPTQKSMDLELFEVKETTIARSDGSVSISKTPKVTGKGQIYFVNKFLSE